MRTIHTPIALAAALLLSPAARAQTILYEGFDKVAFLTNSGWIFVNNSNPVGPVQWRQGQLIAQYAGAHSGDSTSCAESTLDAVADQGTISDWMITPAMILANGDSIVFWALSLSNSDYPDRVEVRMSSNGGTSPGPDESSVGISSRSS